MVADVLSISFLFSAIDASQFLQPCAEARLTAQMRADCWLIQINLTSPKWSSLLL